jgi:hypothetical protein
VSGVRRGKRLANLHNSRNPGEDQRGSKWLALVLPDAVTDNDVMAAKKVVRSFRLVHSPATDGIGVFSVTVRKVTLFYAYREIPCEIGGRGFVLLRLDRDEVYHVRIGETEDCSCECRGFLAHSHCKHIEGLLELESEGLLK